MSGSKDKTLKIWDRKSIKELIQLYGHDNDVTSVVISNDDRIIISGSYDKTIKIWDSK